MWLLFGLAAPFLWAVVHILDEHCVDHLFEKPWMGVVTSAGASAIAFIALPFLIPALNWSTFRPEYFIIAILIGLCIQISQGFYFTALSYSEAGIVAGYWNMIPAILPIISFFFFREVLEIQQYIGIAILIAASTTMCLLDYHKQTRSSTLGLMMASCVFQIVAYLAMDYVYHKMDFFITFYGIVFGIVFFGLLPLLHHHVLDTFKRNFAAVKTSAKFFVIIEIINIFALCSAQMAIKLAHASLVAAVETTVPAFTFVLSIFWLRKMQQNTEALFNHFLAKMLITVLMALGVMLV